MSSNEMEEIITKIKNSSTKEAEDILNNMSYEDKVELDNYIQYKNDMLEEKLEKYRKEIESIREELYSSRKKKQ